MEAYPYGSSDGKTFDDHGDMEKCEDLDKCIYVAARQSETLIQKVCEKIQFQKICSSVSTCLLQKEQRLFGAIQIFTCFSKFKLRLG